MAYSNLVRSEDDVLNLIGKFFPRRRGKLLLGRGDDCAFMSLARPVAVSTDLFLEDVHFRRSYFSPEEIGHKALACNISDLAACGTRPFAFTLGLGFPSSLDKAWLGDFFAGMGSLASKYGLELAGGDLSSCEKIQICVTVFGEAIGEKACLLRGGSMPGDTLFVIGKLGLARVGLFELERQGREKAMQEWPKATQAHLQPEPQVDAGLLLARAALNSRPPALMDVSDGIVRDLPRLLGLTGELGVAAREGAGLGAELLLPAGMLDSELLAWSKKNSKNPVHEALLGGEDYALLGSCSPELLLSLHAAIPGFMEIGTVTDQGKIYCNREPLESLRGFDHFGG